MDPKGRKDDYTTPRKKIKTIGNARDKNGGLKWMSLDVSRAELQLNATLINGQCFSWAKLHSSYKEDKIEEVETLESEIIWLGMIDNYPLLFKQNDDSTEFALISEDVEDYNDVVRNSGR